MNFFICFAVAAFVSECLPTSATRFGDISPLWQNFKALWQFVEGLLSIWENFEPTLANVLFC